MPSFSIAARTGSSGDSISLKTFSWPDCWSSGTSFSWSWSREVGPFHRAARREVLRVGRFHRGEEILLAGGFLGADGRVIEERLGGKFERVAQVGGKTTLCARAVSKVLRTAESFSVRKPGLRSWPIRMPFPLSSSG